MKQTTTGGNEMYVRIAEKNPTEDASVVGWAPLSVLVEQYADDFYEPDAEQVMDRLIEMGWEVRFSAEELAAGINNDAVDSLPLPTVGAVCCFEADDLDDWYETYIDRLQEMGYNLESNLDLRVWIVEGEEKDIEDFEGVYVIAESARDVTSEVV